MTAAPLHLVTGATGFIGTVLCAEMRRRGLLFRRAVRNDAGASSDDAVVGNIGPQTDWSAALNGVRRVIHVAGYAHIHGSGGEHRERMRSVNSGGTEALVQAAERAGVERILFLSTIKVNGDVSPPGGFRETDEPRPADDYAQSKLAAEEHVRMSSVPWTIVRTPLVYGPGVKANFLALIRAIDRGIPLPIGSIGFNGRSLIGVDNLVNAMLLALQHDAAASRTFLVADDEVVSTRELAERIGRALGRAPRLVPMPLPLLRLAGAITGRSTSIARLTESLVADTSEIRQRIGWRPSASMDEGLRRTAVWYLSEVQRSQ